MERPLFRVIIAGGRDFDQYEVLINYCDILLSSKRVTHEIEIVSGCCRGADALGIRYARERGYKCVYMPAHWDIKGKAAGVERNKEMAFISNALIAFWNGKSRGTKNMIETAAELGLTIRVKRY